MPRPLIERYLYSLLFALTGLFCSTSLAAEPAEPDVKKLPTCAYIASYAPGYDWQDKLEKALKDNLQPRCHLKTFYMDSKRLKNESALNKVGDEAKAFIDSVNPTLVIASDDNAVFYVLKRHYRNSKLPFVFCGINYIGGDYGLPYRNTTGMIESSAFDQLFHILFSNLPSKSHIGFLTTTGTTANKNVAEFHESVRSQNLISSAYRAHNQEDWRKLFKTMQQDPKVDFIILDNNAAFPEWDKNFNLEWVKQYTQKLTASTHEWMMPYTAIGLTKSPAEQGEWSAKASIEILQGVPIHYLAVVPNQENILWKNKLLLQNIKESLPQELLEQARTYPFKSDENAPSRFLETSMEKSW